MLLCQCISAMEHEFYWKITKSPVFQPFYWSIVLLLQLLSINHLIYYFVADLLLCLTISRTRLSQITTSRIKWTKSPFAACHVRSSWRSWWHGTPSHTKHRQWRMLSLCHEPFLCHFEILTCNARSASDSKSIIAIPLWRSLFRPLLHLR